MIFPASGSSSRTPPVIVRTVSGEYNRAVGVRADWRAAFLVLVDFKGSR